jgi:tRNA 2-thiouridine synthesizing protein A
MATKELDTLGLRCPQPIMKMSAALMELKDGDILEVIGDCSTFEEDVSKWCQRLNKTLLWVRDEGENAKRIQIQI